MDANDVDVLLLTGSVNVNYATGVQSLMCDGGRESMHPTVAAVPRDGTTPHVFTPYPEAVPAGFPRDHVHPHCSLEFEEGVRGMVDILRSIPGLSLKGKVGIDDHTASMWFLLPELMSESKLVDAQKVIAAARLIKTPDEIECLKKAQYLNDLALYDVLAALRPGVRETDLTAIFFRRCQELGVTANPIDPHWCQSHPHLADGPRMLLGDVPFPLPFTTNRVLREGDMLLLDTAVDYLGYHSDSGRTWITTLTGRTKSPLTDLYKVWSEVALAVRDQCRPGRSGADLTRAARKAARGRPKPWTGHLYLVHGIGMASAETPILGTDRGDRYDESVELQEGMILVLEPCIFQDGVGAYRHEDTVVVTRGEPELVSSFPYTPWEA